MQGDAHNPDRMNSPWVAVAAVGGLHLLLRLGVILAAGFTGAGSSDEQKFHLVAIGRFIEQWPRVDVSDYMSATTPGFHLLMAAIARVIGPGEAGLRLIGGSFVTLMLCAVAYTVGRRLRPSHTVAVCLPLVLSPYLFGASVLVLPESAAWCGVALMMLIALRPTMSARAMVAAGGVLLALVLARQIHLWAAALVWTGAYLGADAATTRLGAVLEIPKPSRERLVRTAIAIACTLPAFIVIGWFFQLWGGPTPPMFQQGGAVDDLAAKHQGLNPATPAMVLSVLGLVGACMAGYFWTAVDHIAGSPGRWVVVAGGLLGLMLAIAVPTSFDRDAGRWTGLWNVAAKFPEFADRSLLIVALSTFGGAVTAAVLLAVPMRARIMLLAALVSFTAANTTNYQSWLRYFEPFALLFMALAAAHAIDGPDDNSENHAPPWWAGIGPVLLAAALGAITLGRISG